METPSVSGIQTSWSQMKVNFQINYLNIGTNAIKESIKSKFNHGYTPSTGLNSAKNAISKAYSGSNYQLKDKDIFLTNGGFVALYFAVNAMVNEGDNILVPSIGYPYYQGLKDVNK